MSDEVEMGSLVTPSWLAEHLADLPHELCDTDRPIAFAMPSPDAFCAAIGRLGVGDHTRVVLYDDRRRRPGAVFSSLWAARAWWMLRWVGYDAGRFLPVHELETRFADLPPGRIITYCGGGIAASAAAFAMLRAGVEDVAVYTA